MPSPFFGTDAVYGLRALLGTSNISDIDSGFAALRDDVASKMKGAVPRVSSLPTVGPLGSGSLVDGQECYLVADSANGVQWHLRYNASSGSAYKWEFVGGPPLYAAVDTLESTTSATFTDLTTVGPSVTIPTLPSGGDFYVSVGAQINISGSSGGGGIMSFAVGGIGAVQNDGASYVDTRGGSTAGLSPMMRRRKTGVGSGAVIKAKYLASLTSPANFASFQQRFIEVLPIRVG